MGERPIKRVELGKVWQVREVVAQGCRVQCVGERLPAQRLSRRRVTDSFQDLDLQTGAREFGEIMAWPVIAEILPAHDPQSRSGRLPNPVEGLRGTSRHKKALSHCQRVLPLSPTLVLESHERINIAALIGNRLARLDQAVTAKLPFPITMPAARKIDLLKGSRQRRIEVIEGGQGQQRDEQRDHTLDQTITIGQQKRHQPVGQLAFLIVGKSQGNAGQGLGGSMVDLLDRATGIVDALEHAFRPRQKAQEACDRSGRIGSTKFIDHDCDQGRQIRHDRFALVPVDKPAGPLKRQQAPINDGRDGGRPLRSRECSCHEPLEGAISASLIENHFRQLLGSECNESLMG